MKYLVSASLHKYDGNSITLHHTIVGARLTLIGYLFLNFSLTFPIDFIANLIDYLFSNVFRADLICAFGTKPCMLSLVTILLLKKW